MFDAEVNSGFTSAGDINISGRFTEITLLHESGNGYTCVYKAKRYGQWHVLKCLTPEAAGEVQYQTLLEKEFCIAYPLSHPNIVRTLGIEVVPNLGKCIIQEYIEGSPISTITRGQAVELCEAVAYIHDAGIIHRDIKPENILVRKDNGHIVLLDFGLADNADFSVLKGGAGSSKYAATEQWSGAVSPAVDIYGIGGVLALNPKLRRIADKCRQEQPQKRYSSALSVKKVLLSRFPWIPFFLVLVFVLLTLVGWGGWRYEQQLSIVQSRTEVIDSLQLVQASNQIVLENMRKEKDSTIQSLSQQNAWLIQNINKEHDFLTYQLRKAELKADSLQQKMDSMYDDYSKYRDKMRRKEQNEYFERFRW